MADAPYVIIPREHQAVPKEGSIYLPHQIGGNGLYTPKNLLSDTDLRSGLKVEQSRIHGLGLFANRDYRIHDTIWYEKLKGRGAIEDEGPLRWTNHSDDPNSVLVLNSLDGLLEVSLVAVKEIVTQDEITYDYGTFGHSGSRAACNCRNENCRGSFVLRAEWGERK